MNPGDVRTFKHGRGNAVVVAVGVWAEKPKPSSPIQIHMTGAGAHTTVTNSQNSERYHRTLFRNLRQLLIDHNCWSFGEEGVETEHRSDAAGAAD